LMGLGAVIPPLAPLTGVGMALTITGSGTSMASTLLGAHWTADMGTRAEADMRQMSAEYHNFATLLGLAQQAIVDLHLFPKRYPRADKLLKSTIDQVTTSVRQAAPVLAMSPKVAAYIYKAIQTKIAGKSAQTAGTGAVAFLKTPKQLDFITKLRQMQSPGPVTSVLKKTVDSSFARAAGRAATYAGRLVMPGLSAAIGIWEVVQGADVENVHKGFVHKIELARRDLEKSVEDILKAYLDMNLEGQMDANYSKVATISSIDFRLTSSAWHDRTVQFEVKTKGSNASSWRYHSTDFMRGEFVNNQWVLMRDAQDLGDVGAKAMIYDDETFYIRMVSQGSALTVDGIQIGVDGRFIPSIECRNGTERNRTAVTVPAGGMSDWMECKRKVGMKKIKFHTKQEIYAGTDDNIKLKIIIPTVTVDGRSVDKNCTTGFLDTKSYDDREQGETDIYYPVDDSFGDCTDDELSDALLGANKNKTIRLTIIKSTYGLADDWTPDLVKIYFTMEQDEEWIITCELCDSKAGACNEGWGVTITDEEKGFECFTLNPKQKTRSLQKIKVKSCDLTDADSNTNKLKLKICKVSNSGERVEDSRITPGNHAMRLAGNMACCTTNLFGTGIERGSWSPMIDGDTAHDDGGEQLGQCEGFPIEGSKVDISLKNEGTDAVCLDEFRFFGGKDLRSSTRDIAFIDCVPTCKLWGETSHFGGNPTSYCEGDSYTVPWGARNTRCDVGDSTETVKKIAVMTCTGSHSGSQSQIKAVIQNMDGEKCTTDALKNTPIQPGHYIESSNMGQECRQTPLKNGDVKVWIVNEDRRDSLCITDVYLDVSSSSGTTRQLKCKMDEEESFKVYARDMALDGLPLTCK